MRSTMKLCISLKTEKIKRHGDKIEFVINEMKERCGSRSNKKSFFIKRDSEK